MITKFKVFEISAYIEKPDVNIVSSEFWRMVKIANWKLVIEGFRSHPTIDQTHRDFYKDAQKRIYTKYDFNKIEEFDDECHEICQQLYDYFYDIWLDEKYNDVMPSDDGYTDLISSVVGLGKRFVTAIINDTDKFVKMAKNNYYAENFTYLFIVDENEYSEIRAEADPLWGDARKYNI